MGTRIGYPDGACVYEAQHTDRTHRHMSKYFAFLFRQYLNLSNLIAVRGRMLTISEAKQTVRASRGAAPAAPAWLSGHHLRGLDLGFLALAESHEAFPAMD